MADSLKFVVPIDVNIGGETLALEPLRGLKNVRAFELAVKEEVLALQTRVERYLQEGKGVSPEALLESGVDIEKLLLRGAPGVITQEILDKAAIRECFGALAIVLSLNNLARFELFLSPEMLLEFGARINSIPLPDFPGPASNGSSSELASLGQTSSAN
jgi:hypothetical protein